MAVRRSELAQPVPESTVAPVARPVDWVACQSYLVDGPDGTRIEDSAIAGAYACSERAVWRVTYTGALTDTGNSALRIKCDDCAESARECFGPAAVALRPL